jgi:uncharacterized protein YtpQ (UPF0354 family)
MATTELKTFVHPQKAYRLEFPAHWEHRVQEEGRSCGFGPYDRDNVGLWISILPMSLDTERLVDELPNMFAQALQKSEAAHIRRDPTLQHDGMKADITAEGEGGHYWIIAGGDLVLFASSQVPVAERETWNSVFDRLMASLRITRDDELLLRQVANEVLKKLRALQPDQDYCFDDKGDIRGQGHVVFLDNVFREVRESPARRDEIIQRFITGVTASQSSLAIDDPWDQVCQRILPVLKPVNYIKQEGPTRHVFTNEWLPDVLLCYVINGEKSFRFVTGWDLERWGIDSERLHERAITNLQELDWPKKLEGRRHPEGGRLILVLTSDSFAASRLLHPDFHKLFSGPLGSPFLAAIPDRDTLVVFSNRRALRKQVAKQVKKDHSRSAYAITSRIFLVTADGVAPAEEK